MFSLGLAAPVHYVVAAFNRRSSHEAQLVTVASRIEQDNQKVSSYILQYHEKLHTALDSELLSQEQDLETIKKLTSPLKDQQLKLEAKVEQHKRALLELEAMKNFYAEKLDGS